MLRQACPEPSRRAQHERKSQFSQVRKPFALRLSKGEWLSLNYVKFNNSVPNTPA